MIWSLILTFLLCGSATVAVALWHSREWRRRLRAEQAATKRLLQLLHTNRIFTEPSNARRCAACNAWLPYCLCVEQRLLRRLRGHFLRN